MKKSAFIIIPTLLLALYLAQPSQPETISNNESLIEIKDLSLELGRSVATVRGSVTNHAQKEFRAVIMDIEFRSEDSSLVDVTKVAVWDIEAGQTKAFEHHVSPKNITSVTITDHKVTE